MGFHFVVWNALITKHEVQRPLLDGWLNCSFNPGLLFWVNSILPSWKTTSILWNYMVTKLKQLQKVKNVKGMVTSGDLCYTALVLREDATALPQGAFQFDLEINYKIFSKFSPPSTKILWLMYHFQLLPEGVKELPHNANEGNISTCMLQLLPLRHGLGTLNQY